VTGGDEVDVHGLHSGAIADCGLRIADEHAFMTPIRNPQSQIALDPQSRIRDPHSIRNPQSEIAMC